MAKKRTYRTIPVEQIDLARAVTEVGGHGARAIVTIDIAKTKMVAGIADSDGEMHRLFRFSHPKETGRFLDLLKGLMAAGLQVEPVTEATGTYGDALRHQMEKLGLVVYRVDGKRVHDAARIYDGVPSHHDAKSCVLLAKLHREKVSAPWRQRSDDQREARVLLKERELFAAPLTKIHGQLEGMLAGLWPEILPLVEQSRTWHLRVLAEFPTAAHAVGKEAAVRKLLQAAGRGKLSAERVEEVIAATRATLAESATDSESRLIRVMANEALSLAIKMHDVDRRIKEFAKTAGPDSVRHLATAFGPALATAVLGHLGDPGTYIAPRAIVKAIGLNLAVTESGETDGKPHITKHGPPLVRKYLFLAALRAIQVSPIVRAWFNARTCRKVSPFRAIVAVMRKLASAMGHVARGTPLDYTRLFDAKKLGLDQQAPPPTDDSSDELPLVVVMPAALA